MNNNGNTTFTGPLAAYTPFGITGVSTPMLAPFFADVDTRNSNSGVVQYGQSVIDGYNVFGVNWIDVGYYNRSTNKLNGFQLIITDRADTGAGNFDFTFNYDTIKWETGSASGGINGFGGSSASAGWINGTGMAYQFPGSQVSRTLIDGGSNALVSNSLNSNVAGCAVLPSLFLAPVVTVGTQRRRAAGGASAHAPLRAHPDPARHHQRGEGGIDDDEQPPRCVDVEQAAEPVADEGALVGRLPGAGAQGHFERGERADHAQPALHDDDGDGHEVQQAKAAVAHPAPAERAASQDEQQAGDDEQHEGDVQQQHGIGGESIWKGQNGRHRRAIRETMRHGTARRRACMTIPYPRISG